jgi:hypothetical protein
MSVTPLHQSELAFESKRQLDQKLLWASVHDTRCIMLHEILSVDGGFLFEWWWRLWYHCLGH